MEIPDTFDMYVSQLAEWKISSFPTLFCKRYYGISSLSLGPDIVIGTDGLV